MPIPELESFIILQVLWLEQLLTFSTLAVLLCHIQPISNRKRRHWTWRRWCAVWTCCYIVHSPQGILDNSASDMWVTGLDLGLYGRLTFMFFMLLSGKHYFSEVFPLTKQTPLKSTSSRFCSKESRQGNLWFWGFPKWGQDVQLWKWGIFCGKFHLYTIKKLSTPNQCTVFTFNNLKIDHLNSFWRMPWLDCSGAWVQNAGYLEIIGKLRPYLMKWWSNSSNQLFTLL